ncbi:glycosyltransferase [Thiovulum sp. ES]|nr:glycosyltransferase [Thiovulum sp. ES]
MKILIISNMYPSPQKPYSGIFVKNQYDYLKKELNQDIEIYAMERSFTNKIGSIFKYLKAFLLFFPYLFKKYDVIHLHYFFPMVILSVFYKILYPKTKIVVTFHGSDITNFVNSNLSKRFFTKLIDRCDYIISVGSDLSEIIFKKLNKKSDLVLSAGIDERVFYEEESIKKEYDFIFVGSFIKRKGLDILLKAIQIVDNKNIRYCIVGSGVLEKNVLEVSKKYNIILLKNQTQEQLRTLYNQSKFFILPSRDEPFGLVVSEAIFCGTPAIVSNIGGMKDQVKDGINGFILKENTHDELAKKIKEVENISEKEYKQLSVNALNSNQEHSLENISKKLIEIYNEL